MFRLLTLPVWLPYRIARRVGAIRLVVFGLGVLTGLAVARETGESFRARLRQAWDDRATTSSDGRLAEQVRENLAQSPRTWHLPQPEVEVVAGRAVLTGVVPHEAGRDEIHQVVIAVDGVTAVDNRLLVDGV